MPELIPDCSKSRILMEARKFDQANPQIWDLVKQEAVSAKRAGRDHYAIATIWEFIRHHINVTTRSNIEGEDFKMPANHCSYYARKYNLNFPQDPKFFTEHHLRSTGPVPMDQFGRELDSADENDWAFT